MCRPMSWPAYYQSNALYAEYSAINISVYQKIFRLFFGLSNEAVHGTPTDKTVTIFYFIYFYDIVHVVQYENKNKLEFGMYPQGMPTEWTHVRTVRPWQSVRLKNNCKPTPRYQVRIYLFSSEQRNSSAILRMKWKHVAAYYFLRTINRRLDLRGL